MPNQLRTLLATPGIQAAPAVYDCLGAMLAARAGFPFVFTSGFGLSAALLGKPDMGYLTATEMIDAAARIAAAVEIPVIADLDTGYGNPLNVVHTVEQVARTRVAGMLLEDQEWPKKCGHFEDKRVISTAEQVAKIKAAVYARGSDGPVIIARTDARAVEGLDGALRRGEAYLAAGADVLFAERFGVIEAAAENGLYAFGNMSDQSELAPEYVVSGPVWHMEPTVDYIIKQVEAGAYTAQDLKDFSMVAKGGASLAPINADVTGGIPQDLIDAVEAKQQEIVDGLFRVDVNEAQPPASTAE
ncbi:MAG: isocitrate lyase/phosphoenolpyruvate mutase family protein [Caldilineaceae bacterium]|nr:isocitrate lyase/phosphoenolpyruvate mutase family protein [Caldilineaceae bacterium]